MPLVQAEEDVWIKKFIVELRVVPSIVDSIYLCCNNNGVIVHAKENKSHQWSKLILICFHLIQEKCRQPTLENVVDLLMEHLA